MFGLDSRAAMTENGATTGFGNLGAALLMAPRLRQQQQMQADKDARAAQLADEDRQFRDKQLAQSLQGHTDQMQLERDRLTAENQWHADQLKAATEGKQPAAMHENSPFKVDPYKHVETVTPDGKVLRSDVLKTPDEVQQELNLHDLYLRKAVNGDAPAIQQSVIADRQARNQRIQDDQAAGGLSQRPDGYQAPRPTGPAPAPVQGQPQQPTPPMQGPPSSMAPASPEVRAKRGQALIQQMGDQAPGDDKAVYAMTSDDPNEVETALRSYYRGQPQAMRKAAAVLTQMHGQAGQ